MFWPFSKLFQTPKCSWKEGLLQSLILAILQKTSFRTILPPVGVSKRHFGASRQSFLGDSGDPNMHKNGQKGLLRCQKAQNNFQNTLGVLRKPFPNFRKIVEFATFRQHWLGQASYFFKGWPPFVHEGGGRKCRFFFHSKCKISGSECRSGFKLVLAHTMDPSGPFWGAHPTEKYVHPKAHPLRNFDQKNADFGSFVTHLCLLSANHVGWPRTLKMCPEGSRAEIPHTNTFLAPLDR